MNCMASYTQNDSLGKMAAVLLFRLSVDCMMYVNTI